MGSCLNLAPDVLVQPPNKRISDPETSMVCPYLCSGGVPLTLNLDQINVSVSKTLISFK